MRPPPCELPIPDSTSEKRIGKEDEASAEVRGETLFEDHDKHYVATSYRRYFSFGTGHVLQAAFMVHSTESGYEKRKWAFGAQDSDVQQGENNGIHHVEETDV